MNTKERCIMKLNELNDVKYMQRSLEYLYDILDDISTADDMAKSDDHFYRKIVQRLQLKKNDTGICSLDGYGLDVEIKEFKTKSEELNSEN